MIYYIYIYILYIYVYILSVEFTCSCAFFSDLDSETGWFDKDEPADGPKAAGPGTWLFTIQDMDEDA